MEVSPMFSLLILFLPLVSQGRFTPTSLWNPNVTQSLQDRLDAAYLALVEGPKQIVDLGLSEPGLDSNFTTGYPQFYVAMANFRLASQDNSTFDGLASCVFEIGVQEPYMV
ncbi:hypothetical protein PM082_014439 [Marasmius tenuissimus]|nr:hypothetical protein PM082_014439 [Marasmius tenuissimus]